MEEGLSRRGGDLPPGAGGPGRKWYPVYGGVSWGLEETGLALSRELLKVGDGNIRFLRLVPSTLVQAENFP